MGLFSVTCLQAPLLPKLRGHFAEFLNKGYPARLAIFLPPTCVGLRYGRLTHIIFLPPTCVGLRYGRLTHILSSFSRQREFIGFASLVHYASHPGLYGERTSLLSGFGACPRLSIPVARLSFCFPASVCTTVTESQPFVHHLLLSAST